MKSKIRILSLVASALLAVGVAGYPMPAAAKKPDPTPAPDPGEKKVTICHVPPGNPCNAHTISVSINARDTHLGHRAHTIIEGCPDGDYLGSCNNPPTSQPPTKTCTLHVISNCTGAAYDALVAEVQSYFEPITVKDSVLDDSTAAAEPVVIAMSECLDKDGSGKGWGSDSVSDFTEHRIRGCQNTAVDTYRDKLKAADIAYDAAKGVEDPIVVSDSSLADADVWKEYKECVKDASAPDKLDPVKTGLQKGDTGYKQHILQSCGAIQDQKLKVAIAAYRAEASTKDIILTESSYNDVGIKAAVDLCVAQGAKDTLIDDCDGDGPVNPLGGGSGTGVSGRQNFREVISPR